MPVIDIDGVRPGLNTDRVIEGIGIIPLKNKALVVIPDGFKEPPGGGKVIKYPVHRSPLFLDIGQGIALKLLNIPVQYQIPVPGKVVLFQQSLEEGAVMGQVVPSAAAHVEIADNQGPAGLGQVQYRRRIKTGTEHIGKE
jgi:hypothetical protein